MKIMSRYIAKTVLSAIGLVTLVLVGLEAFILFVAELDNLGQGNYTLSSAFFFVFLQMPYQVYLFFPVATLLGSLIGLGTLASSSELIAIRTAGATVFQIVMAVLRAAIIVIAIVSIFGETLMPQWVHMSLNRKAIQTSGNQAVQTPYGIWLRNGDNFIHINKILPGYRLEHVEQYQLNKTHQLILSRVIDMLEYEKGHWLMTGAKESQFSSKQVKTRELAQGVWDVALSPGLLALTNVEPYEMNLRELSRYIEIEKKEHQSIQRYELAYWQRWFQPIVSCVMVFLAIPFIFGPLRESSMGSRIVIGTLFGFGFHMLNKFFGSASLVYQFSPIIGAAGPAIVFSALAFFMMRRVK